MKRFSLSKLLFEAPEDEDKKEEPKDADKKDKKEEKSEESDDEESDDENKEKDSKKEKVIPDELKPDDKYSIQNTVDQKLRDILTNIEFKSRESKKQNEGFQVKNNRFSLKRLLLNEEKSSADTIDVDYFANEIARLVLNYDNLIDMEALIVNLAKKFLLDKYEPSVEKIFTDKLEHDHGIKVEMPEQSSDEVLQQPIAIGARDSGGAG